MSESKPVILPVRTTNSMKQIAANQASNTSSVNTSTLSSLVASPTAQPLPVAVSHSSSPGAGLKVAVTSVQAVVTGPSSGAPSLSNITTVLGLPAAGGQTTLAAVPRTLTSTAVLAPAVSISTTTGNMTKIAVPIQTSGLASLAASPGSVYAITAQGVKQDQQVRVCLIPYIIFRWFLKNP